MAETATAEPQTFEFQTETKALLNLVINSLYTHKEVFLRELLSNAADALDKIRLRALTEHDILGADRELSIVLRPDKEAGTLTISDNGIGMSHDELRANLGTIAKSGSREFVQNLSGDTARDARLIGQFGVGFYSAFLVAERVRVVSRAPYGEEAWAWTSEGTGTFQLEHATREGRGTDVILYLREDQKEFLEPWQLRQLVQKYSDFVGHPIKLVDESKEGEGKEEAKATSTEVINRGSALWARPKAEISDEQYEEFYKHISHDWEGPLARTHFSVEGNVMFTGLLFVPRRPPFDLFAREHASGVRLYVKRVFVMDECDSLLPEWLRFVRGVVDSDDLTLNVSREVLQQDRTVEQIKKSVTKKVLDLLEELARDRPDDYKLFWEHFGVVLKEGLHLDHHSKDRLAKLLRYASSTQEGLTSLESYLSRMPEDQPGIYYVSGPDRDFCLKSPHIEGLKAKGYEVLFFVDPIDEWVATALPEFQGKKLISATKGALELEQGAAEAEKKKPEGDALTKAIADALDERVSEVRYTTRLTDSPVCLVSREHDLGANLERILKSHGGGRALPGGLGKRILELNAGHPLVKNMQAMVARGGEATDRVREWTETLYDQALLTEGSSIADPAAFAKRMTRLLLEASALELEKAGGQPAAEARASDTPAS